MPVFDRTQEACVISSIAGINSKDWFKLGTNSICCRFCKGLRSNFLLGVVVKVSMHVHFAINKDLIIRCGQYRLSVHPIDVLRPDLR